MCFLLNIFKVIILCLLKCDLTGLQFDQRPKCIKCELCRSFYQIVAYFHWNGYINTFSLQRQFSNCLENWVCSNHFPSNHSQCILEKKMLNQFNLINIGLDGIAAMLSWIVLIYFADWYNMFVLLKMAIDCTKRHCNAWRN